MAHIRTDSSAYTHIAICQDCGWRSETCITKIDAQTEGVRHERRAHRGDRHALLADQRRRRARAIRR